MSERAGKDCQIKISGAALTLTNAAVTNIDNQSYQITDASKQVLDLATPVTVKVGGSTTTESYTMNYLNGKVTFAIVDAGRGTVTITGKYLPMTVAAYAHTSSESMQCETQDVTPFGATHKKRIAGLKSASGTLSQFNVADTIYKDALIAGVPVVIEVRPISTDKPDRYFALLESAEVAAAIDGVQDETISWVSYDYWIRAGA